MKIQQKAFRDTLPVLCGYLVLGSGFGILMTANGFSSFQAILMSVIVYAGSLQYLSISLMLENTGFLSIAISSLLVNARHLLYGISMFRKYAGLGPIKPYLIAALTDETYSLVCTSDDKEYYKYVSLFDHIYWVSGTVLGCLIGSFVHFNTEGLDFVLTALFIVIFLEQWLTHKDSFSALTGLILPTLALLVFGKNNFLIPSMLLIVAVLLFRSNTEKGEKHE